MLMNNEEWTLGSHVRNQSVENGSMPLGGDTPLTSLYSLSKRSRDSVVSDSRTCGRAPSSISSIASRVSRISVNRLFLLKKPLPFLLCDVSCRYDRIRQRLPQLGRPSGWRRGTGRWRDPWCSWSAC